MTGATSLSRRGLLAGAVTCAALGAYNAGPRRVDSLGRLPLFPETVNYVSDILSKLGGGLAAQPPR